MSQVKKPTEKRGKNRLAGKCYCIWFNRSARRYVKERHNERNIEKNFLSSNFVERTDVKDF